MNEKQNEIIRLLLKRDYLKDLYENKYCNCEHNSFDFYIECAEDSLETRLSNEETYEVYEWMELVELPQFIESNKENYSRNREYELSLI